MIRNVGTALVELSIIYAPMYTLKKHSKKNPDKLISFFIWHHRVFCSASTCKFYYNQEI